MTTPSSSSRTPLDRKASDVRSRRRKRGALGCYTCRYRKVRCTETAPSPRSQRTTCGNCDRLAFDCRWNSPEPGEGFVPPPKRRRTLFAEGDGTSASAAAGERSRADGAAGPGASAGPNQHGHGDNSATYDVVPTASASAVPQSPAPALLLDGELDFLDAAGTLGWVPGLDFITPMPSYDFGPLELLQPANAASAPALVVNDGAVVNAPSAWMDVDPPSIDGENRQLIQHYLETMKSFAKVEDRRDDSNNLYVSAFTRALYLPALFRAILAYSASHLGLEDAYYLAGAELHAQTATDALRDTVATELGSADIEGLLSAVYILIKREHMACGDATAAHVHALLDLAGDVIASPRGVAAVGEAGGFARRITLRLAYVDCRAAVFRLGEGRLVARLRSVPTLRDLFDDHDAAVRRGSNWQNGSAGVALLGANLFRLRVAELDRRLYASRTEERITDHGVRRDEVLRLKDDIEATIRLIDLHDEHADADVDAAHYNRWVVTASYHSSLLYLNHVWTLPAFDAHHSVLRILALQLAARADPLRRNTPSSVWPFSLFMAGISTADPVYRAWIGDHLERSERWGSNIRLARDLMVAVTERARAGGYVDVREVMQATTGEFMF